MQSERGQVSTGERSDEASTNIKPDKQESSNNTRRRSSFNLDISGKTMKFNVQGSLRKPDSSQSSDFTSENDESEKRSSKKKNNLPALLLLKKGKKFLNSGLGKVSTADTSKGVSLVLDSLNAAIARFESLEEKIMSRGADEKSNVQLSPDEVDTKLLDLSHRVLVEMETVGRHIEMTVREERLIGLRDMFRQSLLVITVICWSLLVVTSPIDYFMRAFLIVSTIAVIAVVGEKYVAVKMELGFTQNGSDFILRKGSNDRFASVGDEFSSKEPQNVKNTHRSSVYNDCLSRTAAAKSGANLPDLRSRFNSTAQRNSVKSPPVPQRDAEEMTETGTDGEPAFMEASDVKKKVKDHRSKVKKPKKKCSIEDTDHLDEDATGEVDPERIKGMSFNYLEGADVPFEKNLEELDEEQIKKFEIFKPKVLDAIDALTTIDRSKPFDVPDDFNILRFLQADKYVIDAALERMMATIEWRQKSGIINYPIRQPKDMDLYRKLRPRRMIGRDLENRLVIYEPLGTFFGHKDVPKGLSSESWLKCYSYDTLEMFAEFRKSSIEQGKEVHKLVYIADLKKVKLSHVRKVSLITTLKNEVEVHFPECAHTIFLINAPSFLAGVWKMISKLLDPVVVQKIRIHSNIPKSLLLQELGEQAVPVAWGGKNEYELP